MSESKRYTILPDHRWSWRNYAWSAYLATIRRTDWPILCGPWRGEVGFEVLYWIPFLTYLVDHGIAPERLIPITRGGAGIWYHLPQGLELYAMRTPQAVRVENRVQVAKTGLHKQTSVTAFDRAVLHDAAESLGLTRRYHVLHPAWMFHRLAPYWCGRTGTEWIAPQLAYRIYAPPPLPDHVTLPDRFVAVRFYARETFAPQHKLVRPLIQAVIEQITAKVQVICLDPDFYVDDHVDLTTGLRSPSVFHLRDLVPGILPETNLAVQSAVLARAMGFVGTYGGFAQLALQYARPNVSFYTDWGGTSIAHKTLADVLAVKMDVPSYVVRAGDVPMLGAILPYAEVQTPQSTPGLLTPA